LLRSRLERGDFQEGDRIVLTLENGPAVDTLKVRADKVVQLTGLPELSLAGVLRSELTDTLRAHLAKYLREPAVRAVPLLPVSVLGNVGQPGFYYFAADMVLRDVIMAAGGPASANLQKIVIRRGGETIWDADDVRVALADGLSLDRLHLRAGDEIVVPQRRDMNASTIVSIASATTALIVVILQFVAR
jgi:protein involved in polysaccharide export with SLBB domain